MPRRTIAKCNRRNMAPEHLDRMIEWNLCDGDGFGPWDLKTRHQFARPWARWRDEITRRWRAAFPGSRPMAAYILGEIPAPDWQAGWRPMRPIDGVTVVLPDTLFHKQLPELDHLDALGLVDDDEWNQAIDRLEAADATYHARYQSIADEQEDARARHTAPDPPSS
jgi:hypothetical protein